MAGEDWALELEPPPGGLQALRARLDAPRQRSGAWRWAVLVAGAAVVAVLLVPAPATEVPATWAADPVLVGLDAVQPRGVTVPARAADRVALQPVAVDAPGVVMVRIAAVDPANGGSGL